ncbi:MAG TPA: S8 family serine peptidase, partial [Kofleriaceae bacterium]
MDPELNELNEAGPDDEEVSLILRLETGAEPPPTVRVVSRFGPIITVRCRRADILTTWASDRVISVKAPRAVYLPRPVRARRAPAELEEEAAADVEWDPEEEEAIAEDAPAGHHPLPALPFDGRGVVVGICDWGFDFTHPNFRNPDGSTRLIALWDQRGTGDPRAPAPYHRGRLFTPDAINAALAQPDPCAALGYHPASGDPNNTGSHGTHVSDIVAGNRRYPGSQVGLASGAKLVFVHLGAQRLGELDNLGDSVGLLEGLDFVRRTAAAAGCPCVMHLSAGKTGGPHCGVTLVERAVDALLQDTPGIVLVQSGGNYADAAMHTHARIGPDQRYVIDWWIPPGDRTPNELEIWYSGMDVFDVTLVAPDGQEFSAPLAQRARLGDGLEAWGNFYHRLHEPNSGFNHVAIFLYTAAPTGRWKVVVHGRDVLDGRLHAWIERDAGSRYQSRFSRAQATSSYTTNTICNSFRAIAVGAYDATRPERPPGHFSSRGPTADGRQKPEIAAPGVRILAARSMPRDGWNGERKLVVKSGTSMAAPCVSGTVALMFQAAGRPLTIHEVRRILIGTADPLAGPRGRSSSQLGFGYLNTAAAVEAARRLGSGAAAPLLPAAAFPLEQDEAQDEAPIESTWIEEPLGEPAVAEQVVAPPGAIYPDDPQYRKEHKTELEYIDDSAGPCTFFNIVGDPIHGDEAFRGLVTIAGEGDELFIVTWMFDAEMELIRDGWDQPTSDPARQNIRLAQRIVAAAKRGAKISIIIWDPTAIFASSAALSETDESAGVPQQDLYLEVLGPQDWLDEKRKKYAEAKRIRNAINKLRTDLRAISSDNEILLL